MHTQVSDTAARPTVLITGCGSGFGWLMVPRFLAAGWRVLATTRRPDTLNVYQHQALHVLPHDVADPVGRAAVVDAVASVCGDRLDCLVHNAGYGLRGPLEHLTDVQIRAQLEVNTVAPLLLTRDLLPQLRQARGRVIAMSSVLGYTGMPMQSLYAASKFALEGAMESLAYELSPHGVQVTLIEPGPFPTGFVAAMDSPMEPAMAGGLGVYDAYFNGYLRFATTAGGGADPAAVADRVVALAGRRRMPLRVRIGREAQALYWVRRLLPQGLADRVLMGIARRMMSGR